MKRNILILLILEISAFYSNAQKNRHYNYYLKPQLVYSQKFYLPNFIPKKIIHFNNNIFIFGNLLNQNTSKPAVFIKYPDPTFKILTDSTDYFLNDIVASDSSIYITGYRNNSNFQQGWIAQVDEFGNLIWDKTLNFEYSNKLCCIKLADSNIIVAGTFKDPDKTTNLQLLSLTLDGQIINGKSYAIGKEYFIKALTVTDSKIIVTGYKQEDSLLATLFIYDKNLNTISLKTFYNLPNSKLNTLTKTNYKYFAGGSYKNKPLLVSLLPNFSTEILQTFTSQYKYEEINQILNFDNGIITTELGIDSSNNILSRIIAISNDGYKQWQTAYLKGMQLINATQNNLYSIFSDGTYLTIQKYHKKNNAIWHKSFSDGSTGTPVAIIPSYYGTIALVQNNDTAQMWILGKNGQVISHYSTKNFEFFSSQVSSNKIFTLAQNLKNKQFYIIKNSFNSKVQTQKKINFHSTKPLSFYYDSKSNFYFLTTKNDTLYIIKTDKNLKTLSTNTISTKGYKLLLDKRFIYLLKSQNDPTSSLSLLQVKQYNIKGEIIKSTTLPMSLDSSQIIYFTQYLNSFFIVKTNPKSTKIFKINTLNNQTVWTISLPKTTHKCLIHGKNLITITPTLNGITLNYFSLRTGKFHKSVTYNNLSNQNFKIISKQFLYILATTNVTTPASYVVLKLY